MNYSTEKYSIEKHQIISSAIFIGLIVPTIPWFWTQLSFLKTPVCTAINKVIKGEIPLSTLFSTFPYLIILIIVPFTYTCYLRKAKNKFWLLWKKEIDNFPKEPVKTFQKLLKFSFLSLFWFSISFVSSWWINQILDVRKLFS